MLFAFGPIFCYFLLLLYVAIIGIAGDNALYEYLIILSWYYQILIAYIMIKKMQKK
jgi:hypothetical protein